MKKQDDFLVAIAVGAIIVTFGLFLASIMWGW